MIIDLFTRAWPSSEALGPDANAIAQRRFGQSATASAEDQDALLAASAPVQYLLVHGFASQRLNVNIHFEQVLTTCQHIGPHALPVVGIDPTATDALAHLKAAFNQGAVAVSLNPGACDYHPSSSPCQRILEACVQAGKPVMVEQGALISHQANMYFDQPMLWDEPLRDIEGLRLVLAGFGGAFANQTMVMLAKHRHCYADLSELIARPWALFNTLLSASENQVIDQVCFASGFPHCHPEQALKNLYSLNNFSHSTQLPGIPREILRAIVERDTLALLGIDTPPAANP